MRKKQTVDRRTFIRTVIAFSVSVVLLAAVVASLSVMLTRKDLSAAGVDTSGSVNEYPEKDTSVADPEKEELIRMLEAAESERDRISEELKAHDGCESERSELNGRLSDKEAYILELEGIISALRSDYAGDEKKLAELFSALADKIASPVLIEYEEQTEETENGETHTVTEKKQRLPKLALCYLDLETGYTFSFNGDLVFDSASVIKAPFALSVFRAASDEKEKLAEMEASGEDISEIETVYDFSKKITYTKDKYYMSGTGVIAGLGEGKEYTYSDLFTYMLSNSDNVALHILINEYGYELLRGLVNENRWKSMYDTMSNMSASDGCAVMKEIYGFVEGGYAYSGLMKNAMLGSDNHDLIMSVAGERNVIHKYGWDNGSYHDIGVIYDEHPYAVAVFSDYDEAAKEQKAYIRELLSAVDRIHKAYHESR